MIASRREIMNRLVTIRQEKSGSVPVVVIIEELARILPDNAWLTEVDIRGDTVRIAGFSSAAATLIPLLEQSDYFRAPTFRNPVLRVSGDIGERFTIAMTLERRDG